MSAEALVPASALVTADPWPELTGITPARLALGRAGAALPTAHVLGLALAHARARDAVHASLAEEELVARLRAGGFGSIVAESAAADRATYLRRPDLGRRLSLRSRDALRAYVALHPDVAIVVGDGLSATAVRENAVPVLFELLPMLRARRYGLSPIVLARQARVALGDEIGELMAARLVIMLVGERPGLSAADSLSAYLTFAPRPGRTDAERNCVSNIRSGGLPPVRAAARIAWLIERAFAISLTGVGLKDDSEGALSSSGARQAVSARAPGPAGR